MSEETEKDIFIVSPSSLDTLEACMRRYFYTKVAHLAPKEKNEALIRGDFTHEILENYYNGKKDLRPDNLHETLEYASKRASERIDLESSLAEVCIDVFREYALHYVNQDWEILGVEAKFSRVLYENEVVKILFEGKMDLVVNINGKVIPIDHKTRARKEDPNKLANQYIGYAWAVDTNMVIENEIGFQTSKKAAEKFRQSVMSYTAANINEWHENAVYHSLRAYELTKENFFPMSPAACKFCNYYEICETTPESRPFKIGRDYTENEAYDLFAQRR